MANEATFTRETPGYQPVRYYNVKQGKPHQWEENGLTVTRTRAWTAPGCHEGCGVLVYADKEGNFVKIEGDSENPFNQGRLCPRCLCVDEVINHPDRIAHPMKRAKKERGNADAWERCSWDEALRICHDEFQKIIENHGGDTIHCWRGTGRDIIWCVGRLAATMGSPQEYTPFSGMSCYVPRLSQMIMTLGGQITADFAAQFPDRYDNPSYEIPNCVVLWGANIFNSNSEFQLCGWITDLMKRGTKIITVDPRLTWIASRSIVHLPIRPGTDCALALAIVKVLIDEDLYDHDYVEEWVHGFEDIKKAADEWTLERAAEVCWLENPKIIRKAAHVLAERKPASVLWGVSVDMQAAGVRAAMAIQAIYALTGNIDIPGGMHFTQGPGNVQTQMSGGWGLYELLDEEQQAKRCGLEKYPMYRFGFTFAQSDEALAAAETGKLKGLWIQSSNALCGGQEPERWHKVMVDTEFNAAVDLFMTPTIQAAADVFLPVSCWPERMSLRAQYYGLETINPAVKVRGEAKSDAEICRLLGRMFNKEAWPWETEEEIYDTILKSSGFTFAELQENGSAYQVYEYGKRFDGSLRRDGSTSGFGTPTGKIELRSSLFEQFGYSPVPYYTEPFMGPVTEPELYKQYPLILMTGARNGVFFHSEFRNVERMRQFNQDPIAEIHPKTAADYGLEDGDWAWLENPYGKIRQRVSCTESMKEGTVLVQHAWWFPEQDGSEPNLYGVWKANANSLIPNRPSEFGFGADIKSVLCKIYKANEGGI